MAASSYLESVRKQFSFYRSLGQKTLDQLNEEQLFWQAAADENSVAVIVQHLWGNMLSRWTNFLDEDGEKTWRDRDGEFESRWHTKAEVQAHYDEGWDLVEQVLQDLEDKHLEQIIYIRNIGHTVTEAINRQMGHYAYHTGQIVFLGKILRGAEWQSLSIPKGQSKAYNAKKFAQDKHRGHFTDEFKAKDEG